MIRKLKKIYVKYLRIKKYEAWAIKKSHVELLEEKYVPNKEGKLIVSRYIDVNQKYEFSFEDWRELCRSKKDKRDWLAGRLARRVVIRNERGNLEMRQVKEVVDMKRKEYEELSYLSKLLYNSGRKYRKFRSLLFFRLGKYNLVLWILASFYCLLKIRKDELRIDLSNINKQQVLVFIIFYITITMSWYKFKTCKFGIHMQYTKIGISISRIKQIILLPFRRFIGPKLSLLKGFYDDPNRFTLELLKPISDGSETLKKRFFKYSKYTIIITHYTYCLFFLLNLFTKVISRATASLSERLNQLEQWLKNWENFVKNPSYFLLPKSLKIDDSQTIKEIGLLRFDEYIYLDPQRTGTFFESLFLDVFYYGEKSAIPLSSFQTSKTPLLNIKLKKEGRCRVEEMEDLLSDVNFECFEYVSYLVQSLFKPRLIFNMSYSTINFITMKMIAYKKRNIDSNVLKYSLGSFNKKRMQILFRVYVRKVIYFITNKVFIDASCLNDSKEEVIRWATVTLLYYTFFSLFYGEEFDNVINNEVDNYFFNFIIENLNGLKETENGKDWLINYIEIKKCYTEETKDVLRQKKRYDVQVYEEELKSYEEARKAKKRHNK